MILGSKGRFAVECELKSSPDPGQTIWGDCWIWAGGQRLGEEVSHIAVDALACSLCDSLRFQGRRGDTSLAGKSNEEITNLVLASLLGPRKAGSAEGASGLEETARKFLVCGNQEGFDNVLGVLTDTPEGEKFLWRHKAWTDAAREREPVSADGRVHEVLLERGEYEAVVRSFLDWLEATTGFRPPNRNWVELTEEEREQLRQRVLARRPGLGEPRKWSLLERAAREEFSRREVRAVS
jgi:hypothetical protein